MNKFLSFSIGTVCALSAFIAQASEQSNCSAAAGKFLTGTVVSGPTFQTGSSTLKGVKLSHTHVRLLADQDGKTYDIAMDNVFAVDFVKNSSAIPKSLAAIKQNDRLELCGEPYTSGVGIHWVHTNCNAAPKTTAPNGWVKLFTAGSSVGANLERSQTYCYLWH